MHTSIDEKPNLRALASPLLDKKVQPELALTDIKGVRIYVYIPKGLGEDEEAGEAERLSGLLEEESAAVAEICRIYGGGV